MISISHKTLRRFALLYFIVLFATMWCPTGHIALNSMVLVFRLDHILHAAIYIPCVFAWAILLPRYRHLWLPLTLLVGVGTESLQSILPYRGFDLSDMIANATGALIGYIVMLCRQRH